MKILGLSAENFFTNSDLVTEAGDTYSDSVTCLVSDDWYNQNKDSLGDHHIMENDGDDVKIINCNL